MATISKKEEGVVIEYQGQYWGIQYQDGQSTSYGYGPIENALIGNPEYLRKPESATYPNSPHIPELRKGELTPVVKTITWEV